MQTNPAVEQNKNPWNQSGRKGKGLWRKRFAEEPSLKFRVREDASGDREDGEEDDDELPCVRGESEGDCV